LKKKFSFGWKIKLGVKSIALGCDLKRKLEETASLLRKNNSNLVHTVDYMYRGHHLNLCPLPKSNLLVHFE